MHLKKIPMCAIFFTLSFILTIAVCAQEQRHRHSHHGEILITNDTDTQISYFIMNEKIGRLSWTYAPGHRGYPGNADRVKIRLRGEDQIEIADWGKAYIEDVAEFNDGIWNLSFRHARRIMHRR